MRMIGKFRKIPLVAEQFLYNICWNYMFWVKNVFLISIFPQVKICTAKKTCPYSSDAIIAVMPLLVSDFTGAAADFLWIRRWSACGPPQTSHKVAKQSAAESTSELFLLLIDSSSGLFPLTLINPLRTQLADSTSEFRFVLRRGVY